MTKPSRRRSNGPRGPVRVVVARRQRGQQVEARDAQGVDHAVRAAGEHEVGVAVGGSPRPPRRWPGCRRRRRSDSCSSAPANRSDPPGGRTGGAAPARAPSRHGTSSRPACNNAAIVHDALFGAIGLGDHPHQALESPECPRRCRGRRQSACGRRVLSPSKPACCQRHVGPPRRQTGC